MRLIGRFVRSTTGKVALGIVIGTAISVPAAVFAVASFTDVPTSHPFYKEISAVAGAGIAQGFGDGTYKPSNNVTRQAMAAFLERGVGRAASGNGSFFVKTNARVELAAASIDAGATGSETTGFVRVSASVNVQALVSTTAGCPCVIEISLRDGNTGIGLTYAQVPQRPDGQAAVGAASIETVVPIVGDSTHRYRVTALGTTLFLDNQVVATGHITATYVPLSGDGDATAAYELSCPKDDPWEQNDSSGSASALYLDGSASAISCPTDDDWYWLEVEPGATITVDLYSTFDEGDINVCLYREDTLISCSTTVSDQENIVHSGAEGGNYYINVYLAGDSGAVGNTYVLVTDF